MDIGIFGGTFDPIHNGHLLSALAVKNELSLDRIIIMPNRLPYYKDKVGTSDACRLDMLKLAISKFAGFSISTIELERTTYSYTYDNMTELRKLHPHDRLVFIMGTDSFLNLPKWYRGNELINVTNIAVMRRPGSNEALTAEQEVRYKGHLATTRTLTTQEGKLYLINNPETDISSTSLRNFLQEENYDKAAMFMTPEVIEYIKKHQLYR